jgi:DNA-binding CsgD family transcriptional regulator/DNA polymerase III delta prime subunit
VVTLRPGPLRGRTEPVARALRLLRDARQHGSSGVLLVSGPPGIGKSALLAEVCRRATTTQWRVARSKCDEIEQVRPGAPVIALLRAGREPLVRAPDYEQILATMDQPFLLVDRIAAQLENIVATGPVLVAIDDLQWADRTSRFLLRSLVSRLLGLPVVWLLASRDSDLDAVLAAHETDRVEHLRLAPLATQDIAAIAADRLGRTPDERTRHYLDAAGGNPLLANQIIDSLTRSAARGEPDAVAAEFTAAIAQRVADLATPARDLVQLLAVAGRPLPVRDLSAVAPSGRTAGSVASVAGAVESGLITASHDTVSFRHNLAREAVYATIPGSLARQLHARFAEHYLTVAADPLIAASHARAAATTGDLASARILIAAAETLAGINADEAGDLAALAFRTVRPAQPEWLDLSRRCLSVLSRTQRATEAITVADLILARIDDGNLIGQVQTEAAHALWLSGRLHELTARIEQVLRTGDLSPCVTARLHAAHALARTRIAPGNDAAEAAEVAVEQARTQADREALALALRAAGEAARNEAHHLLALDRFRELRALTGASYLAEEITALQFLDRYDHAQALLDQARADNANTIEALVPGINCAQMWQDYYLGRLDDAEAGARTLIELGQQLGTSVHTLDAITIRAAVALLRGDTRGAAAQLRVADSLTGTDDDVRKPGVAVVRGWLSASRADPSSALDALRPVVLGAETSRSYWPLWPCWNGLFFQVGVAVKDREFIASCIDIAETAAARNPGVASFEGVALNVRGLRNRDLDALAHATEVLDRSPRPMLRAVGAESYGRALLAAGRRPEGLTQLDRAWDEYHQVGARALRADVQQAMHAAGARRAKWSAAATPAPATGWASLTEAERRVAALIAAGHTNKSAASTLGVSINTVGTHLRAIFAKLDVQSRVQLANVHHREMAG